MKTKIAILIYILFSCILNVSGQLSTDEFPVSFSFDDALFREGIKSAKTIPMPDMDKIHLEDIEDEENGLPPRFGYRYKVDYTLKNSGTWFTLPNSDRIWKLDISCPGALSINLLYDRFRLPEGAKFFVYSINKEYVLGAFTSSNNKGDVNNIQGFATGLVYSDAVTLEYHLPESVSEEGDISIAYVVQGYRYIHIPEEFSEKSFGSSGNCQVNVNCSEGANWRNEKNAVAMILVNGNRYCTGSLINTTANDFRPLFLTADHCLGGWANSVKHDALGDSVLNHWSFYWHYEAPTCNSTSVPSVRSTVGAIVVANNLVSDFALLRLTENPINKQGVNPFYLGWDRSGNAGTGGVGIHHPSGDVKKIATYSMTPQSTAYLSNNININANYWRIAWIQTTTNHGVTEGGSSGSPLINSNQRIIGQLHGGHASCSNKNGPDWYGKFSVSWTGNNDSNIRRRLDYWLDPAGINLNTLDGTSMPSITGPSRLCYPSGTYTINSVPANATVTWRVTPDLLFSSSTLSGTGTTATISPYNSTTGALRDE